MPPWAYPARGQDKGQLFEGHSILRRTHHKRVADQNDERRLPLQQVDVDTLSLHWIRSRLNSRAVERFHTVRGLEQQPANFRTGGTRAPLENERRGCPGDEEGGHYSNRIKATHYRVGGAFYGSGGKTVGATATFYRLAAD
ncbi:hypothetical protein DQ04_11091020 [Trypanosoma grayi]|uniref:hypothetical protein n=1 Tax=Trypanosoma grayi TaxID=71804 RepID=UPI0004F3F7B8|nr:hypothetical protein DQ04_11091020 [Trypanosoma grayi]KEG07057.1 hypothetical protein DQ04_11091020 [Trypanosoma grayi]